MIPLIFVDEVIIGISRVTPFEIPRHLTIFADVDRCHQRSKFPKVRIKICPPSSSCVLRVSPID